MFYLNDQTCHAQQALNASNSTASAIAWDDCLLLCRRRQWLTIRWPRKPGRPR